MLHLETKQSYVESALQVDTVHPYSSNTQNGALIKLSEDVIYTADDDEDAVRQILSFREVASGNASKGLIATIDAVVDTNASYTNVFSAENDMRGAGRSRSWASQHVAATLLIVLICVSAAGGVGFFAYKRHAARSQPYTLYDTNVQMSAT